MRNLITGNEAIVKAAIRSGCNYFAGYPITPANSILTDMVREFASAGDTRPAPGGVPDIAARGQADAHGRGGRGGGCRAVAIETEDEIAAIGQCIGAAMAGSKAMTASSGPGLSLYSENIGLAQMGEVPLVIVICQRMGPATGGATATADGDVLFARHVTSGSFPIPVLAATDAATAYWLTLEAFNLAEERRTPVIVLSSKEIAMTRQTVDWDTVHEPSSVHRRLAGEDDKFRPYAFRSPADVPDFAPIGGPVRVRFTGSIHDEEGLLTMDRGRIERKLTHLRAKITARPEWVELSSEDVDDSADTLVISYGVADGAAREAVRMSRSGGRAVSHLTLYTLWPVALGAIHRAVTRNVRRVIVPELNIGLYVDELRRHLPGVEVESITRYDGRLIHPKTIAERIAEPAATFGGQPCPC